MSDFRPGDILTPLGSLRLSLGVLAEISIRLEAPDPATLATQVLALNVAQARHLLISLLRSSTAEAQVARLSDEAVAAQIPAIVTCIEGAFL